MLSVVYLAQWTSMKKRSWEHFMFCQKKWRRSKRGGGRRRRMRNSAYFTKFRCLTRRPIDVILIRGPSRISFILSWCLRLKSLLLRSLWSSDIIGLSYGSQLMGERYFENVLPIAFWDMSSREPKLVPRDQILVSKISRLFYEIFQLTIWDKVSLFCDFKIIQLPGW